jgi:hypothetical protein
MYFPRLSGYAVEAALGSGSFSTVWLAIFQSSPMVHLSK